MSNTDTGITTIDLEQHSRQLECLLAALALHYGTEGVLVVTDVQIQATNGKAFRLDLGTEEGVRIQASSPAKVQVVALRPIACKAPGMMQ
jgi:hypothetical protein